MKKYLILILLNIITLVSLVATNEHINYTGDLSNCFPNGKLVCASCADLYRMAGDGVDCGDCYPGFYPSYPSSNAPCCLDNPDGTTTCGTRVITDVNCAGQGCSAADYPSEVPHELNIDHLTLTGGPSLSNITWGIYGDNTPDLSAGTEFGATDHQRFTIDPDDATFHFSIVNLSDNENFYIENFVYSSSSPETFDVYYSPTNEGPHECIITLSSPNTCQCNTLGFRIRAGEPGYCVPDYDIVGPITPNTYQANGIIQSDGQVETDSDVEFRAYEIELKPGFEVKAGATFLGTIDPCGESQSGNQ